MTGTRQSVLFWSSSMDEIKVTVIDKKRKFLYMRYRCPITGEEFARSTGTKVKREAERAAGKWETELKEGRYKAITKLTWEEFTQKYREEKLAALAEKTEEAAITSFNHVERTIKPQRLSEMTTNGVAKFQSQLRREGMKETSIATHLRQLRAALNWAVRRGFLQSIPQFEMPQRAKGITQAMRGRPITGEELDRMIAKVPEKRKRDPEKWKQLLRGLNLSGLRLGEALALSWDNGDSISVDTSGKYPALRVTAEGQKSHRDELLPIAPEFADFLLTVPKADRKGLVFGIYGKPGKPLTSKRASRYISSIGKAAGVVTNKAEDRYATAHDLRRTFGSRWAKKVVPAILQKLMRHSSVETTMSYYVNLAVEDIGDVLRVESSSGDTSGDTKRKKRSRSKVEKNANADTIDV
jgi:integrase